MCIDENQPPAYFLTMIGFLSCKNCALKESTLFVSNHSPSKYCSKLE